MIKVIQFRRACHPKEMGNNINGDVWNDGWCFHNLFINFPPDVHQRMFVTWS